MPEITENQTPMHRTLRQKNRETHNAVERHRKKKINSGINKIGELIPCSPALKQSKNMILDQAYKYISELKRQNDEILLNGGTKEQGEEIVRLRKQLNELQKENDRFAELLKANDICLHDDPTIHWKRKFKSTKVTMVISSNQMQDDILVYTNGNQLNGNCQPVAVQSSPEQALTTVNNNTPETCLDIMEPIAMPDICSLANGAQLPTLAAQQEVPECLPTTRPSLNTIQCTTTSSSNTIPSVLNVSTQLSLANCASTTLACPANTSAQIELGHPTGNFVQNTLETANSHPTQSVLNVTTNTCFALPLHSLQIGMPSTGVENPSGVSPQSFLGSSSVSSQRPELRSAKFPVTEYSENMLASHICQNAPVSVGGLVVPSPSFKLRTASNGGVMSCCPMASSWTVCYAACTYTGISDSNSVSTFSRMSSAGNTQTTWTTLQLTGNTVHPVSQGCCSMLPVSLNENLSTRSTFSISESGQPFNNVTVVPSTTTAFDGVSLCSTYKQLQQHAAVTMQHPLQPLPLQSVLAQSQIPVQPAAKMVSLLPPLQVIQMTRPAGTSVSSTPNNPNVIIFQPANPTSPAVVRGALNSQAPGQQIVIIQAASQNAVSVVPAQTSNRLPTLDSSQLICSNGNAQNTLSFQTVGGKHLVHILPRPVSSSASMSSQPCTTVGSSQQQTISVNGQLFALQPVKQTGASSQNTMQIIQPTTSADPNTNVALNTFGALTNLSQSISQMAEQGGLQLSSDHTPSSSAPVKSQVTSGTTSASDTTMANTSTDISRTSSWHTSSSCSKTSPLGPPSSCKTKKLQKKPLSTKQGTTRKATCNGSKSKVGANCVQNNKSIKDISLHSLTSGDQILSSQGLVSQQSSLSQIPTLVVATVVTSVTSQEGVDRQQSAVRLSQHVHPSHLTEPAVAEPFSQEQSDILSEISAASTLAVSLPPSSSRGDLVKNVSRVPSPPCVITDVSTSVLPSSLYSSNATLQASRAFSIDKGSDLVDLQTAVANICHTPGVTSVSAQLESLAAAQHQCSGSDKEKSPDWHKGPLEMSKFAATKEVNNQVSGSMIHGVTLGEKTSDEKSSLLSFVKDSCADSELCVDSSGETTTGMSFYEKGEPHKDIMLVSTEIESGVQQQLCNPDQENMGGPLIVHRQTESPMSSSSGSSRGFSVASMLPDTTREDASCISTMSNTFNNYSLSEPNDIVALAARAIFEHGSPGKGLTSDVTLCDVQSKVQKIPFPDKEACASQQSVKSLSVKENSPNLTEANAAEGQTQQSQPMDTNSKGMPITKTSISVVKEISNVPLICTSSGSANLSVINRACHSQANQMHVCSGQTQLTEQLPVCAPADLCSEATTYTEQSSQPTLLTEYSHEHLNSVKGNSQSSLALEPHLKQSNESRKDATKRTGPDDHLISTAKRQKQCQNAAMRLEGKSTVSTIAEQRISECSQTFISQLPTNSSSLLVSSSNPGHTDSLSSLFPPTNFPTSNATETLRPTETHCNVQPRIQEGQGQQLQQHVVSQQTVSSQTGLNVHHSHMYYKHHQGQIRERNLYHLQHHLPHNDSSIQPHAHSAQQPRTAQQEIQMQKKRGVMRGSQAPQLSMQQKQHPSGNNQGRQKGNHHHHHPHHHHQQQLQQMPHPHFGNSQDKRCDNSVNNRNHHSSHTQNLHSQDLMHQQQQDNARSGPQGSGTPSEQAGQSRIQRLLTSRSLDQQMASKSNTVSRPSEMQFTTHRQERNRISSYSAEALIRKAPSNAESRMGMAVQSPRNNLEQSEMRTYLDLSINKNLPVHSLHTKLALDHCINSDVQGLPDCPPFKVNVTTQGVGTFEVQSSRSNEMVNSMPTHRGMQSHGFKLGQGTVTERQARLPYLPMQGISSGSGVSLRENEGSCHQSFMQSLLAPPLNEQIGASQRTVSEHPRNTQCLPPATIEYSCPSAREGVHIRRDGELQNRESCDMTLGAHSSRNSSLSIAYSNSSSVADSQGRNTSPNVPAQKNSLRMNESQGNKCHPNSQVSPNVHGAVRPVMSHATVSHGGNEQGHSIQQPNSSGVTQRVRHPAQEGSASKMRQTDRSRSGNHRSGNVFEHGLQLPLASSSSTILGRQQPVGARAGSIVRFMTDGQQLPNDNLTPDQHSLSQNFGFPFIPESGMNPPINANPSFIPPVTQPGANRTPALIPVEPQNPLSSFYPPYSPAHPNLSNDLSIPYFSNQIFSSPSTEKTNTGGLNNPFGSILSPPRPVGFPQPNFPLLPEIPARPMANTSSITPHLSNFNLTTLFPEIAAAPLAPDSTAMPMSPLLPLTNPALSDVSKQHSNRSAHNISHILGHDGSSAV
ncbi:basic helix-loop-helix domain-containing protein USF3 isoform X1 [Stegostoma tigrinum]|uniref:basic helix-loop-helix domain-containing protein USF3 isoform X1 n=2 Tax=Stegostoma tigrinum TaxID=3053191 RepID=UPI00287074B8|nr:basic helix-loop-helix domain-containing protein USF3 isoform X1 [Stegostoma tigrinum]XP_059502437.1 basic helix-loop-helix domain-containing protein USF3 isoform X1 [Stegostoma tigrinum]